MTENNAERARRGFEAAARGDFGAVEQFLDPDVTWHGGDPSARGSCHDRVEALEFIRRAHARGGIGELVEVVDAGEQVVVILRPPAGERLVANLTTFRDGRATELVHYADPDEALAAIRV
jgi:ketosteroid isomerase-like protein